MNNPDRDRSERACVRRSSPETEASNLASPGVRRRAGRGGENGVKHSVGDCKHQASESRSWTVSSSQKKHRRCFRRGNREYGRGKDCGGRGMETEVIVSERTHENDGRCVG